MRFDFLKTFENGWVKKKGILIKIKKMTVIKGFYSSVFFYIVTLSVRFNCWWRAQSMGDEHES